MTVGELIKVLQGYDSHLPVTAMNVSVFRDTPREIREAQTEAAFRVGNGFEVVQDANLSEEDCESIMVLRFW